MTEQVGRQLQEARLARNLSLEQVARATLMRERYLRALEAGEFETLPSLAQARGFLRAYAQFLTLDPEPLIAQLDRKEVEDSPLEQALPPAPVLKKPEPTQPKAAEEIFRDLGRRLRHQRELLGLTLEEVARYTLLRQHYLEALDAGAIDDLPSPVNARGMLELYATFLGLDPEPLLLRFAEGLQVRHTSRLSARSELPTTPFRRRRPLPAPLRRLFSPDILIGVGFGVFLTVFLIWGALRVLDLRSAQEVQPSAPSIADVLLATPTPPPVPTLETLTPPPALPQAVILPGEAGVDATQSIILSTSSLSNVQVYVTVLQRAWMRVTIDGEIQFEGRVLPGSAYPFVGESVVEILAGNASALRVFFNQQDLGLMGAYGEVVNWIFTPLGIVLPTPTITPTPTLTPRTTPTAALPAGLSPTQEPVIP